jgi:hypothetical protein
MCLYDPVPPHMHISVCFNSFAHGHPCPRAKELAATRTKRSARDAKSDACRRPVHTTRSTGEQFCIVRMRAREVRIIVGTLHYFLHLKWENTLLFELTSWMGPIEPNQLTCIVDNHTNILFKKAT